MQESEITPISEKPEPRTNILLNRYQELAETLRVQTQRLTEIINRVEGERPQGDDEIDELNATGYVGLLDGINNLNSVLLDRLATQINQLEQNL